MVEGEEEHEVEAIINHKVTGRKRKRTQYLVSWKGWDSFENSWEPEGNLKNAPDILNAYKKKHKIRAVTTQPTPTANSHITRTTT